jgi:hypothetical protein
MQKMKEETWASAGMDYFIINDLKAAFEKCNRKTEGHKEGNRILDTQLSINVISISKICDIQPLSLLRIFCI